jgi:hypothetical protein
MSATSGFTGANTGRTNGVFFIGDALLLGANQKIESEAVVIQGSGAIRANDSIAGNEVIIKNCSIFIDGVDSPYSTLTATLSHAGASEKRSGQSNADLTFDGCVIIKRESAGSGARRHYFISNLYDTRVVCENNPTLFLSTEPSAKIKNLLLKNCSGFQPAGAFAYATGLTLDATELLYSDFGRLEIVGFETVNPGVTPIKMAGGVGILNYLYLWNKGVSINNTKYYIVNPGEYVNGAYRGSYIIEGYSVSWKFVDTTSLPVSGVKVCLYDNIDNIHAYNGTLGKRAEYITNSAGKLVGTWDSRLRTTGSSQVRDTLFLLSLRTNTNGSTYSVSNGKPYSLDAVQNQIAVKSYLHAASSFQQGTNYANTAKVGAINETYSASIFENFYLNLDASISEQNKSVVDAYTELGNPLKLYDRAKAAWYDNESYPLLTRNGNAIDAGSYNVTLDATAAAVYAFNAATSTITIKASYFVGNIEGTGTFTLLNGAEILGTFGSTVVYPWEVANIEAGSTLQLFNVTQNAEIENLVVSGTAGTKVSASGSYATAEAALGDTIRLRVTRQTGATAFLPFESFGVATASGLSFRADQSLNTIYNSNSIDGSGISGISLSPDYTNVEIDLSDSSAPYEVSAQSIYAYYIYLLTTSQGIANFFGAITPIDRMNYQVNSAVVPIKIQNTGSTDVVINGGRIFRDDGVSIISTGTGAGTGSLVHDTGFLLQFLQPQVAAALTAFGTASATDLTSMESRLKKKITQAALL